MEEAENPQTDRRAPGESDLTAVGPDDPPIGSLGMVEESAALADSEGSIRSGRLAGKSLWAAIWILSMPVLLQQLMQACVGLVDKMLAGNLPGAIRVAALDAVGVGSYIGWLIGIAMAGLGIGGQAVIARAMGAGNVREAHHALGQTVTLSVLWGAVVGVGLWYCVGPLADMAELSPEATRYCSDYVRTLALSMPACAIMMTGAMCLHGAGDAVSPALIALLVNVVNVALSWALCGADVQLGDVVLANPFGFDLHVTGIAAGTSIAYVVGAAATLLVLRRGIEDLRLEMNELRLRRVMIFRIVRVGLPNFLEGISMWGVNLFVIQFIGVIAGRTASGEGLQGAHIIAVQWEAFSFLPGFAIGTAAGALAGQYLGAGNPRMASRAIIVCAGIAAVIMGLLGVLFVFGGEWLTALISREEVHLRHAPNLLLICGIIQVFFALNMVVRGGLRGVGDTRWTLTITTVSSYGVRLPAAWLLGVYLGYGIEGIWMGLCGEIVIRASLFTARFLHGGWKRIVV